MKSGYSLWIFPIIVVIITGMVPVNAEEPGWPRTIPDAFGSHGPWVVDHRVEAGEAELWYNAGFRVARYTFGWEDIETEKGKYNFSKLDVIVEMLTKHGIRPLLFLGPNPLYDSGNGIVSEEARKAFVKVTVEAAKRYAGKNIIWEVWHDPNIGVWGTQLPSEEYYCLLVAAVAPEIKRADPTAKVIAPSSSGIPLDWLEGCFKRGLLEHVDAVSVHPWRTLPPETVVPEYEQLRQLIKRYAPKGNTIPILSTFWGGYACHAWGLTHEGQAQYIARMFLINPWQGVPISISWDWRDWGKDWNFFGANCGVVTADLKPKLAYFAIRTLSQALNRFEFDSKVDLPEKDVYVLAFRKGEQAEREKGFRGAMEGEQRVYAVWTTGNPREIALPLRAGKGTLVSMYGDRGEVSWTDDGLKVMATGNPQYLILR